MKNKIVEQVNQVRFVYFVTDIHGRFDLFENALFDVGFEPEKGDIVICGGDMIDRGDNSLAVLRLINEPWFYSVQGNHEEMAYEALTKEEPRGYVEHWINNGGSWYYKLNEIDRIAAKDLIIRANELPLVIEVNLLNGMRIGVIHADYPFDEWGHFEGKIKLNLLWSRNRADYIKKLCLPEMINEISGIDAVVFGHTIFKNVTFASNQVFLDTGAIKYGQLAMLSSDEILAGVAQQMN